MHGVRTNQSSAVADFQRLLSTPGIVDYTLGGDFGGGVFVIGRSEDWDRIGHYFDYLKMGAGPDYLFFRPYHLCHVETPLSIAEAVLYQEATIAPRGAPVAEVVAVAKRDLRAGEVLDGIGGAMAYGQIDRVEAVREFLPIGLSEGLRLTAPVAEGEPIPREAVEVSGGEYVWNLRMLQDAYFQSFKPSKKHAC
jgi:predicted homoserine dehydrogenase-like protein